VTQNGHVTQNDRVPPADPALLAAATEICLEAGRFTLRHFRDLELSVEHKGDGTPVTIADLGAERLMRERIGALFPEDSIVGEEEEAFEGTSGRRWVVDPIDGTSAFTYGVALYCNLLYVEDEWGPAVGVINIPAIGEVCAAGRGLGATLNDAPCRVSEQSDLKGSLLTTSGFEHWDPDMLARARESGMKMRTWGDGFGYALVATGRAEAMVDPEISVWDIAPCRVIIPEAGGRCSSLSGVDSLEVPDFVATNGRMHDTVLEMLCGAG
jgi:histidinol phosphatase-like enzyme (inositol monophosphatase family)